MFIISDKSISQLSAAPSVNSEAQTIITQFSSSINIAGSTISAQASDQSFNDSANGFVVAGFAPDDRVNVVGFSAGGCNIYSGVLTSVTPDKIIVGGADGASIVDEGAGSLIVITKWVSARTGYGGGHLGGGRELLISITKDFADAGDFEFVDIDTFGTFKRLVLIFDLRSTISHNTGNLILQLNGDLGSNYAYQYRGVISGSAYANNSSSVGFGDLGAITGDTGDTDCYGCGDITFPDYAGSSKKRWMGRSSAPISTGFLNLMDFTGYWYNTDPITSIKLRETAYSLFGTAQLYGEN